MDDTDRRILELLMRDGRMTFAEIAQHVGMTPPAVKRRVEQLRANGDIIHFAAVVNPKSLGLLTEAYVEVSYRDNVPLSQISDDLSVIPQIVDAATITGEADALVHLLATDMSELESIIEQLRMGENIVRTKTLIVMSRVVGPGTVRIGASSEL